MPTVSFYLRNDDYDKWRKLEKPGDFIHNALNPQKRNTFNEMVVRGAEQAMQSEPIKRSEAPTTPKDNWTGPLFRDKKKGKL